MDQRKPNISPWYALGLAVVLVVFSLMAATGVTWARYRTDVDEGILFEAREPVTFYLGKIVTGEDGTSSVFQQTSERSWETTDGQTQLQFAIANGTSADDCEDRTQQVRIRLTGSLGILTGEELAAIKLVVPMEDAGKKAAESAVAAETEKPTMEFTATAVRIAKDSPMYTSFGDGWVFYFLDEEGEELVWTLNGGALSYIDMTMILESGTLIDTSLLQLQVTSELAE